MDFKEVRGRFVIYQHETMNAFATEQSTLCCCSKSTHLLSANTDHVDGVDIYDDQNDLIERFGGREAALSMGTPGATPAPGQEHEQL